jgi:hypothetical protein
MIIPLVCTCYLCFNNFHVLFQTFILYNIVILLCTNLYSDCVNKLYICCNFVSSWYDHTTVQVISHQLLTVEAGVCTQAVHVGLVVDKLALGHVLLVLQFPLSVSFHHILQKYSYGWTVGLSVSGCSSIETISNLSDNNSHPDILVAVDWSSIICYLSADCE